jgi:uncharacterized protein (TIGR01777 family)
VRILLTGSSGLIGRNLLPLLRASDHQVIPLIRTRPPQPEAGSIFFDPKNPDLPSLDQFDAVIHLAGENVAKRWIKRRKQSILASRADFTAALAGVLSRASKPPAHFLCASGINYYGHQRDDPLTEDASTGDGFLAEVCRQWEAAAAPLRLTSTRIVHMRTPVVLTPQGGALKRLLTPFRLGLGGVIGSGRQIMSWISLPDMLNAILHLLNTPTLTGPVNMTTPNPVTNRQFTKTLGKILHRPTICKVPAFAVKLAFGQMAVETILASQNAVPAKLLASGFEYRYPKLEEALRALLVA